MFFWLPSLKSLELSNLTVEGGAEKRVNIIAALSYQSNAWNIWSSEELCHLPFFAMRDKRFNLKLRLLNWIAANNTIQNFKWISSKKPTGHNWLVSQLNQVGPHIINRESNALLEYIYVSMDRVCEEKWSTLFCLLWENFSWSMFHPKSKFRKIELKILYAGGGSPVMQQPHRGGQPGLHDDFSGFTIWSVHVSDDAYVL